MRFSELSEYLQKLEKTSSRNEITQILAEVFGKSSQEEIDKICYLVLGRIEPQYTGLEFNFAERMMIRAISRAYDVETEEVTRRYKTEGDLGDTAHKYANSKSQILNSKLSVEEVYGKLYQLAMEGGKDSLARKLLGMSELLKDVEPLSAKYIVRIPLGKLRLGFADATILDALSTMKVGDKSARKKIEGAYSVMSDIGEIAKRVKAHPLELLEKVHAEPGIPVRTSLAERLPTADKIIEKVGPTVAVEPKMDGFRCVGGFTPIYTRDKGYISIKDIRPGDFVLTHKGRFKKVIAVNKRTKDKKERVFRFQTYLGDEFKISQGHQMLVWKQSKVSWTPVENVSVGDEVVFPKPRLVSGKSGLFPNPHLALGDESGYTKTIPTGEDFYKFLGFWIGDGFTNEFHNTERVGLLFNAKTEVDLAKEYEQIIQKTLGICRISNYLYGGVLSVYWRDKPLKTWLTTYFRREWRGKMLPFWFSEISKENFLAFLKGWIDSDGTPRHGSGFKIITKERDLAMLTQLIGASHEVILGVRKVRLGIASNGFMGTYYEVIVPGTKRRVRVIDGKLLVRVLRTKEIARPDPRTTLYNLQVEGDESYCTGMVALHNCQIHITKRDSKKDIVIFSRNHENTTSMFPEIVTAAKKLSLTDAIFDGEAIGYNPETKKFMLFAQTVSRKRKHDIDSKAGEVPLKVFVFDVLYLNGQDLISKPFLERRKILEDVIGTWVGVMKPTDVVMLTRQVVVDNSKDLKVAFDGYMKEGLEGIMAKKLDAPYHAGGRGYHWVKYKKHTESKGVNDTIDCVLMGAYRGKGKRIAFGVGGFLLGVPGKDNKFSDGVKFYSISNLGTGLTDEQFRSMYKMVEDLKVPVQPESYVVDKNTAPDIWIAPKVVLEILADEITISPRHTAKYSLRFPRLIRVREDKNPEQATSVHEVGVLYTMQGGVG